MLRNFNNSLAAMNASGKKDERTAMAPTLRADIYSAMDQAKAWLVGGQGAGQAGDGVSFGPILTTIKKHFPDTNVGLDSVGQAENEVAIIVGSVTNMILEMSRWDAMAGGMVMGGWIEAMRVAHTKVPLSPPGRKEAIAKGIMKGVNERTDVSLMSKEFAARVQIISQMKTRKFIFPAVYYFSNQFFNNKKRRANVLVSAKIWGAGSKEARDGEALLSSKFI
jgi:hypothetical protein